MFTPSVLLSAFTYMLELLPLHVLAYYPFRGRLRFPLWTVLLLTGLNMSLEFVVCCHQYALGQDIRMWDIFFAFISMAIYLSCVKAEIPKLLFIYTLIVDYIMIARGSAVFLDLRFFRQQQASYRFLGMPLDSLIRMIPILVTAPFMLMFLDITKEKVLNTHAPQLWRTIWLIPALISLVVLMFTWDPDMITVAGMLFILARVCLLIMTFIVYYVLVSSLESLRLQGEAEERARNQEQLIAMERAQYSMLQKQIEETRQARHDLRQHLNVIQSCLESGNNIQLKDYIAKYSQKLASLTPKNYCSNYAVNAVVCHYGELASENNIRFDSHISLPAELWINEPDICIIFGNLLENAIDSCLEEPGEPSFIRVHARVAGDRAISITVDNSCKNPPVLRDGAFLSSKHPDRGTGMLSVRSIAARYNGIADFQYKPEVFYASVFLNPHQ